MATPEMFLQAAIFLSFISPQQARRYFIEFQQQQPKNFFLWVQENRYLTAQQITQIQQHLQIQKNKTMSETNQVAESFFIGHQPKPCFDETIDADTQSSGFAIGTQFNHYIIQKELGKGGMGIVYQALDRRLQRVVAIKVIRADVQLTAQQIEQFLAEARAIAQIDHRCIVKIYEIGNAPQHYLAMEYIPGKTLKEVIGNHKWPPKKIAAFMRQCALALDFVHNKNIIHRDLKPSNIILDQAEKPKITDFGLAKEVNRKKEGSSGFIGTPAYASPEQVRGAKNISYATDVYSLGTVLYEFLTQRPPYQGEIFNIFFQILNSDLIAPRNLNPDIPKELEAICLKAMHKSRKNRYRDMRAFARDLQNYIEDKPVVAKPPSYLEKCAKFVRRNKLVSSLVISTFIALIITIVYLLQVIELEKSLSTLHEKQKKLASSIVDQEKVIAVQKKDMLEQQQKLEIQKQRIQEQEKKFYRQEIVQIYNHIKSTGNSKEVEERLQRISQPDHFEWRWLQKMRDTSLHSFHYNEKALYSFFEAAGTVRSFYTHHMHSWKPIFATQTTSNVKKIVYEERVLNNVLLSPNRKMCAYLYTRGVVALENLQTKKVSYIKVFDNGMSSVSGISFHANGKTLVAWGRGFIHLIDCVNHKLQLTIDIVRLGNNGLYSCQLIDDELLFSWHSSIYKVHLPKIKKTQLLITEGMRKKLVTRLDFSNVKPIVSLKCTDDFWIIVSLNVIYKYDVHSKKITAFETNNKQRKYLNVAISHNQKYLVAWVDNNIDLWSIEKKQLLHSLVGHNSPVNSCNFSDDDKVLFSHDVNGTTKIWEIDKRNFINDRNTEIFQTCAIDNLIINVGMRKVTIWDLQKQKLLAHHFSIHQFYSVSAIKIAPQQYTIIAGHNRNSGLSVFTWDGKILRWQKFHEDLLRRLSKQSMPDDLQNKVQRCFFINYQGRQLFAATYLNKILIWEKHLWLDNKTTPQQVFGCSSRIIHDIAYERSRGSFAIVDGRSLHIWKPFTQSAQTISKLSGATRALFSLTAVTWIDEQRVVIGNRKGGLFVVDIEKQQVEKILSGHFDVVKRCAINKQQTRLISTDVKGNAYVWDLSNEREVTPLLKLGFHSRLIGDKGESLNNILFVENQKNGVDEHVLLTSREATYILHAPYFALKKQKK